jgi:hypothetical protein
MGDFRKRKIIINIGKISIASVDQKAWIGLTTLFTALRDVQLVRYLILFYIHLIPLLSNKLRSNTLLSLFLCLIFALLMCIYIYNPPYILIPYTLCPISYIYSIHSHIPLFPLFLISHSYSPILLNSIYHSLFLKRSLLHPAFIIIP